MKFFQTKELFTPKDDLHDFLREYSHATGSFCKYKEGFLLFQILWKKDLFSIIVKLYHCLLYFLQKTHDLNVK